MEVLADERDRPSDSPLVAAVMAGRTVAAGCTIRPAEPEGHLVIATYQGRSRCLVVGPLTTPGVVTFIPGAEILWIRLRLGVFMPHLPASRIRDLEVPLPAAANRSFWLQGSAWQYPNYENADTFVQRLVREGVLAHDPAVTAALQDQPPDVPARTLRHRFLRATGLTQGRIRQVERAKRAAALLRQGVSILDTVHAAGYFDQPHLTRALKRWIGYTPAHLAREYTPACRSIQDSPLPAGYDTGVPAATA